MCFTLEVRHSPHPPSHVDMKALGDKELYVFFKTKPLLHVQVRFIVMNNVFQNALPISKQYDLKGSTQGRTSANDAPRPTMILKDLDLDIKIKLEEGWHDRCDSHLPLQPTRSRPDNMLKVQLLLEGIGGRKCRRDPALFPMSSCTAKMDSGCQERVRLL